MGWGLEYCSDTLGPKGNRGRKSWVSNKEVGARDTRVASSALTVRKTEHAM